MKKTLLLLLYCCVLPFGGCRREDSDPGKIKIGISLYQFDDAYMSSMKEVIIKAAKEQETKDNIKITLNITDAAGQQALQNEQVDAFIAQGYNAICVNMVDRTAAAVIIDKAKAADIPVIFFNREPVAEDLDRWDKVYYVGAKAEQSGKMQGDMIARAFRNNQALIDKNEDQIIQYVMLEGELGHQDALLRTEYSIKELVNARIKVEKLANDSASWKRSLAKEKMTGWLNQFGGAIEVVFANNDEMALGAIDALKDYNLANKKEIKIVVVGIDATEAGIDAVKNREMYATVLNDGISQGRAVFEIAYSVIQTGTASTTVAGFNGKKLLTDYSEVTFENVFELNR